MLLTDISRVFFMEEIPLPPSTDVMTTLAHNIPPSDAVSPPCSRRYNNTSDLLSWSTMLSSIGYKRTVILFYREEKKKIAESLFVRLKSILHPFLYIPDDVALELSPQMSFPEEHPPFRQTRHFWARPWVYKRWRTFVITTPSWWSDMRLKFGDDIYLKYRLSRFERILDERLQRSGKYLLDAFVCSPRKRPERAVPLISNASWPCC